MTAERWRPVVGWEGLYEVSDLGRVRSLSHMTKTGMRGGRVLKAHTRKDYGYRIVDLTDSGRRSSRAIHTLVADAFVPNPEFYPLVRHLNGDPADNRAVNLGWGTYRMNIEDAQRHGTMPIAQHGSLGMYTAHGCRCPECRAANAAYHRERYAADPEWAEARRVYQRNRRARKKETTHA